MEKNNTGTRKLTSYLLFILIIAIVLVFNYDYLMKYLSSNKSMIIEYNPKEEKMEKVKPPAVAGLFYSAKPEELRKEIGNYLDAEYKFGEKKPKMIIVPHAGYRYSAQVAAKAYLELEKNAAEIKTVFVIGPSHHVYLNGAAIPSHDYFATPLGDIPLDKSVIDILKENPIFQQNDQAFVKEHSIEVQLPFLQNILKNFKIIPIVYGKIDAEKLAEALEPFLAIKDTAFIFSADLSHYHDAKEAESIDASTAEMIDKGEPNIDHEMSCGAEGINTALILAKKKQMQTRLLDMNHSGNTSGDMERVVGYGAWAFEQDDEVEVKKTKLEEEVENIKHFVSEYGNDLFNIASLSLEEIVVGEKYKPSRKDYPERLFDKGASFVTLYKNGDLRGCIGSLYPNQAIALDVAENTRNAAMHDDRFSAVTADELKDITISISFLTGYEQIEFTSEEDLLEKIVQGVDGVVIRDGNRQGLFLPSVWTQISNKEDFLKELKLKAGMSPLYWSDNIKVYRFRTVEIKRNENQ